MESPLHDHTEVLCQTMISLDMSTSTHQPLLPYELGDKDLTSGSGVAYIHHCTFTSLPRVIGSGLDLSLVSHPSWRWHSSAIVVVSWWMGAGPVDAGPAAALSSSRGKTKIQPSSQHSLIFWSLRKMYIREKITYSILNKSNPTAL